MRARLARIALDDVRAALGQDRVTLIDISRSGVLVRTTEPSAPGTNTQVTVWTGMTVMSLMGRVVRCVPDSAFADEWRVALEFLLDPGQVAVQMRPLFAALAQRGEQQST